MEPFNLLTQTRYGQMLVNRHDVYIGRSLQLYGEWSEGEIDLFRQVLRPGMVAVDAGANIGTHTLAMAQAVAPNGRVYAFEPQRIVFQTLAANVALNSLTNVFCQQRALGEEPGIAWVPPINYAGANNFGGVELGQTANTFGSVEITAEAADRSEPVEVTRIDAFELAACHLIKIDVEGMELAVLKGAEETIARCQPLLYVEADRAQYRDAVITWLDEHGYRLYWHQVPLYNPANFKGVDENVFETIVSVNILAIPASVPGEVVGLERVTVPGKATGTARDGETALNPQPEGTDHAAQPEETGLTPQPLRGANTGCADIPVPQAGEGESGGRAEAAQQRPGVRRRARAARSARPAPRLPLSRAREAVSAAAPVLQPPGPEALIPTLERAVAHHQEGRIAEATALYEAVLAVQPDEPDALHLLGIVRRDERRLDEALPLVERAASLVPEQPLFQYTLGALQRRMGRVPEAEASLRRSLALSPESVGAHLELGLTLLDRRDLAAAESVIRAGLALNPDHDAAHFGLGGLLLLAGRYREGWEELSWRHRMTEFRWIEPVTEAPTWAGEPLDGRTILLETEQGHGDAIQFARYVPMVAARGGAVVLRCRPELRSLLATLDGVAQIILPGEPLPPVDFAANLMELPRVFGTTVETIPADVPYVRVDPARVAAWADRLASEPLASDPATGGTRDGRRLRRVGLVWAGSPDHWLNDQRSTTLAALAPLGAVAGVRFYGLQKGAPSEESLAPPPGLDFVDLGPNLTDFMETAAALSALDLVITVDTSVGHLAGALGRPAWVLPWATHDWRWLLDRDDSPWYPSVRLFRQQAPHAWGPVVEAVAAALRQWSVD